MPRAKTRKRRCKICKRWFLPDVRHTDRQKTCGPECRKELHRRQCAEYNHKNRKSAKANYLQKKLDAVELHSRELPPEKIHSNLCGARIELDLPRDILQEAIGLRLLVVIEYVVEQILQRRKRAEPIAEDRGNYCETYSDAKNPDRVFKTHQGFKPP